jgi:transcriptional regulator with XRE-family HTH domain
MTNAESIDESIEALDPGMVRAGAAAAARRRELDISQRSLAADGIINAGALIAFEKGRSWPRERTRQKLEEVLRWPPGTIASLRKGGPIRHTESGVASPTGPGGDEVSLIAQAVVTAVSTFSSTVASLPAVNDPAFTPRVTTILKDLRQLEAVAARAARIGRVTPPLIRALGTVRSLYDDLMMRAAGAPHATLGQRLYAARRGANLTVLETAQAAGVSERTIELAEADEPVSGADVGAIEELITQIS